MKATALICMTMLCATTWAQETTTVKPKIVFERKNEVGMFIHTFVGDLGNNQDLSMIGLNYNRWITKHLGYRVLGGYGIYNSESGIFQKGTVQDTFIDKNTRTSINLAIIGGGIQAQRQFYKKVYLFAAIELRGGYGSGNIDTLTTKSYRQSEYYTTNVFNSGQTNVNMFYVGISPTVGAKIVWKHVSVGAELFPLNVSYQSVTAKTSTSTADFNMGNIAQRFFLLYRF